MIAGRIAEPDEEEIEHESPSATVAIEERMDLFEARVMRAPAPRDRCLVRAAECLRLAEPPRTAAATSVQGGGAHPAGERLDVVLAEAPRASRAVASGCGATSQTGERRGVDLADLRERESSPSAQAPGSSAWPYTHFAAVA